MIKKLFTIAAVAVTGLLAAPQAEAGHSTHASVTYVSGHASCGCPIQTRRYVRSYDCYRRPIFGYSRVPFSHGSSCRLRSQARSHSNHNHGRALHRSSYSSGARIVIGSRSYQSRNRGSRSYSSSRGRTCR